LLGFAGAIAFYAQPAAADPFSWQKIYPIIHMTMVGTTKAATGGDGTVLRMPIHFG